MNNSLNSVLVGESDTQREDLEDITHLHMEVSTNQEEILRGDDGDNLGRKRDREDDSSGSWTTVNGRGKKFARKQTPIEEIRGCYEEEKVEICIYNSEKFPKQFALARLFKTNDIVGILRVKYINPFKLLITFDNESHAEQMMNCKIFTDMGWRSQKSWEVAVSYGIIRNIELDLSIEEFVTNVSCDVKILSAIRLNRRCKESPDKDGSPNGWTASESLRICFKGAHVPSHVNIFGMRAKVERYTLPVTQCSKCWKYGHIAKMCSSSKIICPKCGGSHENCEKTTFVCVNCKANHLALDKKCPVYLKEKRLRELMCEFNCTYRKALLLYVPPSPTPTSQVNRFIATEENNTKISQEINNPIQSYNDEPTYADITKSAVTLSGQKQTSHSKPESKQKLTQHKKRWQSRATTTAAADHMDYDSEVASTSSTSDEQETSSQTDKPKKSSTHRRKTSIDHDRTDTSFSYVISKITHRLMNKGSFQNKIKYIVKIIVEWLRQIIVKNLPENSIVSKLINGLS